MKTSITGRQGLRLTMLLALGLAAPCRAWAEEPPTVVLGIDRHDAAKYNVEFMRYGRTMPLYKEHRIQASLMGADGIFRADWPEERLYEALKQYHVVAVETTHEGVYRLDEAWRRRAEVAGRALARYVSEGGGLFLQPRPVRYPGGDDEAYWNLVLAPFGAEILHEGVFDKSRSFEGKTLGTSTFWFTRNLEPHAVTEAVPGLCLPLHDYFPGPGIVAMKYSTNWQVVARGEAEAKSYRSGADNRLNLEEEGSYASAPPVVAVRSFGKGRVASFPIVSLFTGGNYGNPLWSHIVETRGDPASNRPSAGMRLLMNAYRWLGEPATAVPAFGAYRPEPYKPMAFPAAMDWDPPRLAMAPEAIAAAKPAVRAVFGARSAYAGGKGTVAEYAAAAKAAGVSAIVFADPLEQLTAEKLEKLKADCAAASGDDLYACPGVEFTDGIGNRWAFWGEKVVWPDASFQSGKFTHVQWDGQRVNHYGQYSMMCQYPGSALVDYRQLRANGAHPENLWWFFHYFLRVYDHGQRVADNFSDYLFGLRDMRWAAIAALTRISDPAEVASAAGLCTTAFNSLPNARAALNSRCAAYGHQNTAEQYVTEGPVIASWRAVNNQRAGNVRYIRGVQRVRLYFAVRSEAGIAEVRVHDADRGPIRRFLGRGERQLAREFELVHDEAHYPTLEVIDTAGRRAFSRYIWIWCYKAGLFRCGDNLNILGPTAMCWHPDRNEFFNAAKEFRNGSDYHLVGWDTSSSTLGVPRPQAYLWDMVRLQEAGGDYPHRSTLNAVPSRLLDVGINNYDLQIATMRSTALSESFDNAQRPTPALATVPRDVGDMEFYERTHTIYAPMERVDMFVAWDHRRDKESRQNYRGGLIWHEGEFRFKKDVTLQGHLPMPLYWERAEADIERNIGTTVIVTDADGSTRVGLVTDPKQPFELRGRLRPGGYAAWMPFPVGYQAFLAPVDMDFVYHAHVPTWTGLKVGLGEPGQVIKAGTVMRYRFGVATFADAKPGNDLLEHTVKAMNLGGGHAGYPVEMKAGRLEDAVFFFTAAAQDNEARFALGPQTLIIDLPIRVRGLERNGCAAVFSTQTPRFRFIPVDADGVAWLTEPIDRQNELWVGNILVADRKELKLTVVVDGQAEGQPPLVEVHNPTDEPVTAKLVSPPSAPLFGGVECNVTVPAGDSVWLLFREGKLLPREEQPQ